MHVHKDNRGRGIKDGNGSAIAVGASWDDFEPGFGAIFYGAPLVLALVNDDGRVERINHAGATYVGRGEEELLGLLGGEVFRCVNAFKKGGCGGTPYCGRCSIRTSVTATFQKAENIFKREGSLDIEGPDGIDTRYFHLSTNLIEVTGRKRVLLTLDDVTALKRAEMALKASEAEYRTLFAEMTSALVVYEAMLGGDEFALDFRCVSANPGFEALVGWNKYEMVGHSVRTIFPGSADEWVALLDRIARSGEPFHGEMHDMDRNIVMEVKAFSPRSGIVATLVNDITDRKQMETELQRLAATDALTGVNSRRQFLDLAERERVRAARYGRDMAFLMIDIDHFKAVNDTYGHAAGDAVLAAMADASRAELRETDVFGRLGGEEFAVVLIENDVLSAAVVAERLRARIMLTPILVDNTEIQITVSVGISTLLGEADTLESLIKRADQALYRAKHDGRNRIVFDA